MLVKEDPVQSSTSLVDSNVVAEGASPYDTLLKKVEESSSENYEEYIHSDFFLRKVTKSLEQASELFYLSRLRPDVWQQFEDLLPDYQNYQRGTPREGVSVKRIVDANQFGTLSAKRESRKLADWQSLKGGGVRNRDIFDPKTDNPNTYETPINPFSWDGIHSQNGQIISKKEFEDKARNIAEAMASNLIVRAKKSAEIPKSQEKPEVIITMRKSSFREFLETGRYKARLDKAKFSKFEMLKMQEVLKPGIPEDTVKKLYREVEGGLNRRKVRQVQLGIDPQEGEPNPVYGELIIDPELELPSICNRGYGSYIHVVLEDDVLERTVYYIGDSVSDASILTETKHQVAYKEAVKARRLLNSFRNMGPQINWTRLPEYIEADILGGIKLEDVKEFLIKKDEEVAKVISYIKANPQHFKIKDDDEYFRVTMRTQEN
jgi:hypothetical protein